MSLLTIIKPQRQRKNSAENFRIPSDLPSVFYHFIKTACNCRFSGYR